MLIDLKRIGIICYSKYNWNFHPNFAVIGQKVIN